MKLSHAAIVALCLVAQAQSAWSQTLYGCVLRKTGSIRMVTDLSVCKRTEAGVSWNQVGPPGAPGPLPTVRQVATPAGYVHALGKARAQVVLALDLAPGSYLVSAKATVGSSGDSHVYCALTVGSAADEIEARVERVADEAIALTLPATLSAANQAYLICFSTDEPGFVWYPRIVATPIGGFVTQ